MRHRLIEVPADRLPRWVAGFGARHGELTVEVTDAAVILAAASGAVARLAVPFGPAALTGPDPIALLADRSRLVEDALLLLVRRGGVAVGVARAGELVQHRTDRRYVQSRTAAGGWSQQRFARRRAGQAAGLVTSATAHAAGVLAPQAAASNVLVVGGDRALVEEVLADPRLRAVAALPRSPLLDVPDPRLHVLTDALRRGGNIRAQVDQP